LFISLSIIIINVNNRGVDGQGVIIKVNFN
jgi:hypothetical protein